MLFERSIRRALGEKTEEEWRKWLDPKHMWRQEDREIICCMNIKFVFKQHKEKKILKGQMNSEIQSQRADSVLREQESSIRADISAVQIIKFYEDRMRELLQTRENLIWSMKQSFEESS